MQELMSMPKPPFLVFDGYDLSIFESMQTLEYKLEAVDVENGVYEVFDSQSNRLILMAKNTHQVVFGGLALQDQSLLSNLLLDYAKNVHGENVESESVSQLIDMVVKKIGFTK